MNLLLDQAIENSRRKNYHGDLNGVHHLLPKEEQLRKLREKLPQLRDFYEVNCEALPDRKFNTSFRLLREVPEAEWRLVCMKRWEWIDSLLEEQPELGATDVTRLSLVNFY